MFEKIAFSVIPAVSPLNPASGTNHPPSPPSSFANMVKKQMPKVTAPLTPGQTPHKQTSPHLPFRAMSFNIRWDDNEQSDPKHCWKARRDLVSSILRFHRPDVIGIQEPFSDQLIDLVDALETYECYRGVGLAYENQRHAHNPIFYSKERFELLQSGFFFLSPTPHEPSLGWDASIPRSVSWVRLKDLQTNKDFYFFNTHFDYFSKLARNESARLLRQKIEEIAGKKPFIAAGDFNIFPNFGGAETFHLLTDEGNAGRPLIDAQTIALHPHHGPTGSWSGFKEAGQPGIKPDYLFVDAQVTVLSHGILADTFDGEFASDHLPVVADVSL